jgi:plastocyanin
MAEQSSPPRTQAPGRAGIAIIDYTFEPASLLIQAGDIVTWTNLGAGPHTVTADDGSFDAGPLAPGTCISQVFPAAGLVTYHCAMHPQMTGAVTVTEAPA